MAIDASRMLFNGAPGAVAGAIDALAPAPGERVLHIGTGLGYYTAIIADCVGPAGRVVGVEVDEALAAGAAANLSEVPWAQIVHGDGSAPPRELFDAILINAGVTHILPAWLDALAPGGRLLAPITATMPSMLTIGKGLMVLVTRGEDPMRLGARMTGFVAIYSAVGVRDDATNALVGKALSKAPFAAVRSLRLDAHDPDDRCWVHAPGACLSLDP